MTSQNSLYEFPVRSWHSFRVGAEKYRLGASGKRTLLLLAAIYDDWKPWNGPNWLISHRNRIREIAKLNSVAAFTYVIGHTENQLLRILAIWLRGHCGSIFGAEIVSRFVASPNDIVRKEVARSLTRMGAWWKLEELPNDPNPRVRALATPMLPRPYKDRLSAMTRLLNHLPISQRKPEIFLAPEVDFRHGRRPKSRWLIRFILQRIHRWVAGRSS